MDAIVPPVHPSELIHPIEAASYRILAERVDLSAWPAGARDVVARMIHATADESFAATARIGEQAVEAAVAALIAGAPVVCDARMVVAGIPRVAGSVCFLDEVPEAPPGDTRSAAAVRLAAARHPDGALWVVGNAPTALFALLDLHASGAVRPGGGRRPAGGLRRRRRDRRPPSGPAACGRCPSPTPALGAGARRPPAR